MRLNEKHSVRLPLLRRGILQSDARSGPTGKHDGGRPLYVISDACEWKSQCICGNEVKHETLKIAQKTDVKVGVLIVKSLKINRWAADEDDARTCTPNANDKTVSEELPVRLLGGGGNRLDGCGGGGGGVGNGGRPGQQSNKRRRRRRYRIVPTPTDPRHTATAATVAVEPHRHRWRNYPVIVTIIIIFCFCAVVVGIMTMVQTKTDDRPRSPIDTKVHGNENLLEPG